MAQLGKISKRVLDSHGNPISGATVAIRTQGAFVTSTQAGPTYTVNDPGGIVAATSTCQVDTSAALSRACTAATATTVTFGILGFGSLTNNQRITVSSPLPTLYADAQGAETKTNPLTTDANGYCYAWIEVQPVDIKVSATGFGTTLETDVLPDGQEYVVSNIFQQAGAQAFRRGTTRTLTSGHIMSFENPIAVNTIWDLDYAGNVAQDGNLTVGGTLAVTGNVTFTGDLTVDDITCDDITMDDLTVDAVTAGSLTVSGNLTHSGGTLSLQAGSIETADLATQCTMITRTADGTADDTLTAAAAYADITGATLTFTPASSSSEIVIMAYCPVTSSAAANAFFQIADGSNNALHEGTMFFTNANSAEVGPLVYRVTGLTGSQTFKVRGKCTTANCSVPNSTNAAVKRVTRIIAMEFKK